MSENPLGTPLSQDMIAFGATFTPAVPAIGAGQAIVTPGQAYWACISADGPIDIGNNHHIYVDVLDASGKREVGVTVEFFWDSDRQHVRHETEAKPGEDQATNEPIWAGNNAYGVRVIEAGVPSDSVQGMGLVPWEKHKCYKVVFKRAIAVPIPIVPTTPPASVFAQACADLTEPPATMTAREYIDEAIRHLQSAKELL